MNSSKVRIYELSRELNLDNKDILVICDQLNIAAKSHSSTITESEAEQIRATAQKNYSSNRPPANTATSERDPNTLRTPTRRPLAPLQKKPRKQQILEIRKHQPSASPQEESVASAPSEASSPQALVAPPRPPRPGETEAAPTFESSGPVSRPSSQPLEQAPQAKTPASAPIEQQDSSAAPKPKITLVSPPNREDTTPNQPQQTLVNRPVKRSKLDQSEAGAPRRQAPPQPGTPSSARSDRSEDLQGVQLIRPTTNREAARRESQPEAPAAGDPNELLELHRPVPLPSRPKRTDKSRRDEEEDPQEMAAKAGKTGAKPKRKSQVMIEDEEEEGIDTEAGAKFQVDVSQSLVRPPRPKSTKQPKPASFTPARTTGQKGRRSSRSRDRRQQEQVVERPEKLILTGNLTVQELASELAVADPEVIKILFLKGIAANVNQILDIETATMVAHELEVEVEIAAVEPEARKVTEMLDSEDLENLQPRPPVVTIMGHVDHGKTTLLDAIRKTKVAQGEAGGITQHIGAYHVDVEHQGKRQQVVFLDTPGHEAFTAMRARGTRVTDVAILVVAADDGVRPQTVEAISHARAAEVPLIVAINKVDKEGAQIERVKQELTEYELVSEEWGGETVMVPVSAINGENLDALLEMILLVAEVEDLYANPDRPAKGTVIEAHLDKARGPVATLLVQNGTLSVGNTLVAGSALGKVRAMIDDRGDHVKAAAPSFAVEVLGLGDVPAAGDDFEVFRDEKEARVIAGKRSEQQRQSRLQQSMASRRVSLNALSDKAREGELKELNLVLKADVQGSLEAILGALGQLPQDEVQVRVLFAAPGEISETDVDLATASEAVIIGFNTTLATGARQAADRAAVDIREYNVIYKLLEDIEGAMEGLLEPELVEEALGQAEVRAVFPVGRGAVAGCYVQSGKLVRNCKVRIHRGGSTVHEGVLDSLKRMREDAREVNSGYECGVGLDSFQAWEEGDTIEAFRMVTKRRTLAAATTQG